MRSRHQLEFVVGAAFLLGPMVYALTLPTESAGQCEESVVVVEFTGECSGPPEPSAGPLAFAFLVGEGSYVVLADDVDASWGTGRFFEPDGEVEKRVAKRADLDRIDAQHRAQIGRTFDVYDEFGKECSAKIERLMIVAQYDWGVEGLELAEYDPETNEQIEHSAEAIQEAVWTTQDRWLVGVLDDDECGGMWARDAALPAPTILTYSREPSPTLAARIAHFEREELPPLREDYEAFRAEYDDQNEFEPWDVRMAESGPEVGAWIDTAGVAHFVTLTYGFDDSECGFGHSSEIESFDAVENGAFERIDHQIDVATIFDVDLDGNFEQLYFGPVGFSPEEAWTVTLVSETEGLASGLTVYNDHAGCPC